MAKRRIFLQKFTSTISSHLGRSWVFIVALFVIIVWLVTGPFFGFSDTWQLIVNTATTVITFLMVFIIQNTQNRDNIAINIKLDTLMQKTKITHEELIGVENKSDIELEEEKKEMENGSKKPGS